jgi:hypothetical protein
MFPDQCKSKIQRSGFMGKQYKGGRLACPPSTPKTADEWWAAKLTTLRGYDSDK